MKKNFISIADGKVTKIWRRSGSQNIRLNPGSSSSRRSQGNLQGESVRGEVKEIFKENQTGLLHNFFKTHHRFDEEARNDFWSIYVRTLNLSSWRRIESETLRWTQSQTLLVERRIISNSSTIHRRNQSNKNGLGCNTKMSHRRLLKRWRGPRSIRYVDWFHTMHNTGWKISRRIYMNRETTDKEVNSIQIRSSVIRILKKHVRYSPTKRTTKVDD